jgi:hypothetical protein
VEVIKGIKATSTEREYEIARGLMAPRTKYKYTEGKEDLESHAKQPSASDINLS